MPDSESLRTSVAGRIDQLCQQFEAAWQRGDRLAIDELVEKADVADRELLRRELRHIEAQLEAQLRSNCETDGGASPQVDKGSEASVLSTKTSQLVRLADAKTVAPGATKEPATDVVLAEPTSGNLLLSPGPSGVPSHFGRYQVVDTLGEGGYGVVYRGFDPELQRDVAIKVPRREGIESAADAEAYLTMLNHEKQLHMEVAIIDSTLVQAVGGGEATGPSPVDRGKKKARNSRCSSIAMASLWSFERPGPIKASIARFCKPCWITPLSVASRDARENIRSSCTATLGTTAKPHAPCCVGLVLIRIFDTATRLTVVTLVAYVGSWSAPSVGSRGCVACACDSIAQALRSTLGRVSPRPSSVYTS